MLEIASQMILCLLLASLLGFIIGYLFGKGTCANDDCGQDIETHDSHDSNAVQPAHTTTAHSEAQSIATPVTAHTLVKDTQDTVSTETISSEETANATSDTSYADKDDKPMLLSGPRDGVKDNLTRIKGIGLKIEEALNTIGIYHFDQIAAWDAENIAWADSTLGFPGRAERENWVAQAKALDAGEETEFSKRVDAGKVSSSKRG